MFARTIVAFDNGPELRSGDLLVLAARGPQLVRSAGSDVHAAGTVRMLGLKPPEARSQAGGKLPLSDPYKWPCLSDSHGEFQDRTVAATRPCLRR